MGVRACCYRVVSDVVFPLKGLRYPQTRRFLEKSQWWSPEQLRELQNDNIRKLIEYVYRYVPYYARIMKERGLKPINIQTTNDLVKLPVLSKDAFREHWKELLSTNLDSLKTNVRKTGGSTGEPLRIVNDYSNSAWEGTAFTRGLGFAGYRNGETIVRLFGGSLGSAPKSFLSKIKAGFTGCVFLPAFEISDKTLPKFVETIKRSKAQFMHGYTSAIYLLAKLMDEVNITIPLKAVFPTSENLYDFQRVIIEKVFQCEVFNQYGCGELNSIAFECKSHSGLHITDENVFLEALKNGERMTDGEMGALTLTTFHNYALPLIRYQNSDIISINRKNCLCGRGLTLIEKLYGRANDLLLTSDGRLICATFMPWLFLTAEGIKEIQVVQEKRDLVVLKIVKGDNFSAEDLSSKTSIIRKYLGSVEIQVEYVLSIPKTPQGKLKYVISKFGEDLLCRK